MKANELRIGNWVSHNGTPIELTRNRFKLSVFTLCCSEIEPIPLTEEWFENFGAKKDDLEIDSYVLSSLTCDYRFFKTELIGGDTYWTCEKILGDTCIEYVHQLQNLYFALTGQELELK